MRPGGDLCVGVIVMSMIPAAASPSRYSRLESAPALADRPDCRKGGPVPCRTHPPGAPNGTAGRALNVAVRRVIVSTFAVTVGRQVAFSSLDVHNRSVPIKLNVDGSASVAQHVNVMLVDDIDGSEASETLSFGLDGRQPRSFTVVRSVVIVSVVDHCLAGRRLWAWRVARGCSGGRRFHGRPGVAVWVGMGGGLALRWGAGPGGGPRRWPGRPTMPSRVGSSGSVGGRG